MKSTIALFAATSIALLAACGSSGDGEVIRLNPPDGIPSEGFLGIDAADINMDGFTDLIAALAINDGHDNFDHQLAVFLQNSAAPGTFEAPIRIEDSLAQSSPWNLRAIDLTGNGLMEIVIQDVSWRGFRVFLPIPDSPGRFAVPTHFGPTGRAENLTETMAISDIDGDLFPDVLLSDGDSLVAYYQDTSYPGTFAAGVEVAAGIDGICTSDVDGDGFVDLLTFMPESNPDNAQLSDTLFYHRHNSSIYGDFLPPIERGFGFAGDSIAVADVDDNGRNDIIVTGGSYIAIFRQSEFGTFPADPERSTLADERASGLSIADLDSNGSLEIVVGQRTAAVDPNAIEILSVDAGGHLRQHARLMIPDDRAVWTPALFSLRIADLNDDRRLDIAVSTHEIFVFFQRADQPGAFEAATRIAAQR